MSQRFVAIHEAPQDSIELRNLLHRGGLRMRTHEAGSRQWDRSRSDCPRQAVTAWRSGSGPPALRFRAAARDATPRSAFRFVSGDAPHERGWRFLYINFDK